MPLNLPNPPADARDDDAPIEPGYYALRDIVGATIEISDVDDLDGIPIVIINNSDGPRRRYLCNDEWASQGATVIQAELNSSGDDAITVRVVEEAGFVGFRVVT